MNKYLKLIFMIATIIMFTILCMICSGCNKNDSNDTLFVDQGKIKIGMTSSQQVVYKFVKIKNHQYIVFGNFRCYHLYHYQDCKCKLNKEQK